MSLPLFALMQIRDHCKRFNTGLYISYHITPLLRQWSVLCICNNSAQAFAKPQLHMECFLSPGTQSACPLYFHIKHASFILLTRSTLPITPISRFLSHFPSVSSAGLPIPFVYDECFKTITYSQVHLTRKAGTERSNRPGTAWACMVAATNKFTCFKGTDKSASAFEGLMVRTSWQWVIATFQQISSFCLV